jgi:hypothetical protein
MLIAIDPGVSGGISYEDTDGSVHALPMPETLHDLEQQLWILCKETEEAGGITTVYLEDLPKFAGRMSGSAMGTMFRNYGRIEGILSAIQCRIEYIRPQVWQKVLGLGAKATYGDRWKAHLKGRAQALFPQLTVTLKTADALLILEAARKMKTP